MTPRRHGYLLNFDWEIPRAREDSGLEEFTASFDLIGEVGSLLHDLEVTRGRVAAIGFDRIPHRCSWTSPPATPGSSSLKSPPRSNAPHPSRACKRSRNWRAAQKT